jgi:hypothetical protein
VNDFLGSIWDGDVSKILAATVPGGFWHDDRFYAACPFHDDQDYSFCYQKYTRNWSCNSGCGSGDLLALGVRLWNCSVDTAEEKILALGGREPSKVVRRYPYLDAQGQFVFEILRYAPKNFGRRIPVAWVWKDIVGSNSAQGPRILYRLPEVLVAPEVLIVEGEKDCETARSLGLVATCNPGGSSRWHQDYVEVFRGKRVEIISDADDGGRRHARQIAGSLVPVAHSVKLIEFLGVKDLTEWVEAGGTAEELLTMFWKAQALQPEDVEGWWDPNGTVQLQCGAAFLLNPELGKYGAEPQYEESESQPADETCEAEAPAGEENDSDL